MPANVDPIFTGVARVGIAQLAAANTGADLSTNAALVFTGGTNGSKVTAITAASTDTSARVVALWLTRSATSYALTAASVAIASGTDGTTPSTNLMGTTLWPGLSVDGSGQYYLLLQSGDTLQASMAVAVTAAKEIDVTATYADY